MTSANLRNVAQKTLKKAGFTMFISALCNKSTARRLTGLLLATTLLSAAAPAYSQDDAKNPTETKSFSGSYLSGLFAKRQGMDSQASDYLNHAITTSPESEKVQMHAFRLDLAGGRMENAVSLAQKLAAHATKDPLIALVLTSDAVKKGDFITAQKHLASLQGKGFDDIIAPIIGAWVNYGAGLSTSPVTLDSVITKTAGSPSFIYFQLALINDMAGFKKEALEYYLKASENSKNTPYRVVAALGNFYEREGRKQDADKLYAAYLAQNLNSIMGNDTDVFTRPREMTPAPIIRNTQEGLAELYSIMAGLFYTESSSQDSLYYLRLALHLKPDFPSVQLMLGDVLVERGEHEAAEIAYEAIDKNSYYYRQGRIKRAFNLNAMGKPEKAIELLEKIATESPNDYEPLLSKGDILRDEKRFKEAASAYSKAIDTVKKHENRHWPMFYVRGICYERAGEWDKAEADFLKALELEPGQPDVLNYLGYSWLVLGKNIDKAKTMIETAIAARPDDAHIIDSMGWALYALKEYDGAVAYLEQAVEIKPHDPTINDHLGDAYWRVGRKLEAKFQWERALSFSPEEKEAAQLKTKLTSGLPDIKDGKKQAAETPVTSGVKN